MTVEINHMTAIATLSNWVKNVYDFPSTLSKLQQIARN